MRWLANLGEKAMLHQLTENETWVQALLLFVYQPMVASKSGRFPLTQIAEQFSADEQPKFVQGIDALVEMNILVIDGKDICITNISEALLQLLHSMALQTEDEFQEMIQSRAVFSSMLAQINNDARLAPPRPIMTHTTPPHKSVASEIVAATAKQMSFGEKIFYGIFVILVLMGLLKVFLRPLIGA